MFISNVPSPYRVAFFNELGKHCLLTVLFEKSTSDERDESWKKYSFDNFSGIIMNGKSVNTDSAICFDVIKYLKCLDYDEVICSDFSSPTGILAVNYMRRKKISYYLEADGGFPGVSTGLKYHLKHAIIKGAKGYFSTSDSLDEYFLMYGAKMSQLIRYPFSSVYDSDVLSELMSESDKKNLRQELSIPEDRVLIAVGQFIYRKGFDLLIEATKELPSDVGVYIVGGSPSQELLDVKEKNNLCNLHFLQFMDKANLFRYYQAADAFVLPTREDAWGLVVNEAMACGLPVVTTDRCGAGVTMIEEGISGYVVPVNDKQQLAAALVRLARLEDAKLREMGQKAIEEARKYTIETMVEAHLNILL